MEELAQSRRKNPMPVKINGPFSQLLEGGVCPLRPWPPKKEGMGGCTWYSGFRLGARPFSKRAAIEGERQAWLGQEGETEGLGMWPRLTQYVPGSEPRMASRREPRMPSPATGSRGCRLKSLPEPAI
ncbi:hypothetical protein MRX96_049847 [Rhipicephalus microplus]